jgi:hypothetical protein
MESFVHVKCLGLLLSKDNFFKNKTKRTKQNYPRKAKQIKDKKEDFQKIDQNWLFSTFCKF